MKRIFQYGVLMIVVIVLFGNCKKNEYSMGALTAPSDVTINTNIAGKDADNPNGDGSGDVTISLSGKNVLSYLIDYDASDGINLTYLGSSTVTKKYTSIGLHTYRITVVAYGPGATATTVTKDILVQSNFTPAAEIVDDLTGSGSKTWVVNKDMAGHFGVGPWSTTSTTPEWYSAAPNEKSDCCHCFYSASFTFAKAGDNFTLTVATPEGAFTKTGALAGGLPGIPSTGDEGCYSYGGGSSGFAFVPASSGIAASTPTTGTSILLGGNNTFIGYGALQKEYEILTISESDMYLRVQGTEPGNAWYVRLKAQ